MLYLIVFIIGFIIGGGYIQIKEEEFAILSNFCCKDCSAIGCQGMHCYNKRKEME